jgi:hypothetical protein
MSSLSYSSSDKKTYTKEEQRQNRARIIAKRREFRKTRQEIPIDDEELIEMIGRTFRHEYYKKYREKNKIALSEQKKDYYKRNKKRIREYQKKYAEQNREYIKAKLKENYKQNKVERLRKDMECKRKRNERFKKEEIEKINDIISSFHKQRQFVLNNNTANNTANITTNIDRPFLLPHIAK